MNELSSTVGDEVSSSLAELEQTVATADTRWASESTASVCLWTA